MLAGLGALAVLLPLVWQWKHSFAYLLGFAIFWFYLLVVVGLTLFPLPLPLDGEARRSAEEILARVHLAPFYYGRAVSLRRYFFRSEMFANVLMTIPFGLLFPWLSRVRWWAFLIVGAGIGLLIEGAQLAISLVVGLPYRVVDINDVLMNAAGAVIGYVGYLVIAGTLKLARRLAG